MKINPLQGTSYGNFRTLELKENPNNLRQRKKSEDEKSQYSQTLTAILDLKDKIT